MLKLLPNASIMLEQIHNFKVSVIAELTILYWAWDAYCQASGAVEQAFI